MCPPTPLIPLQCLLLAVTSTSHGILEIWAIKVGCGTKFKPSNDKMKQEVAKDRKTKPTLTLSLREWLGTQRVGSEQDRCVYNGQMELSVKSILGEPGGACPLHPQGTTLTWSKAVSLPHQELCFSSLECRRMIIAKRGVMGWNGCKHLHDSPDEGWAKRYDNCPTN